jgi:hypothetical protein
MKGELFEQQKAGVDAPWIFLHHYVQSESADQGLISALLLDTDHDDLHWGRQGEDEGGCHALAAVTPNVPLSRAPSLAELDEPLWGRQVEGGGCHALAVVAPNIPLSRAPSLVEPDDPHTTPQWPPPPSRSRSM